jgi:acetoin utilization deacetylase AcuC-like enzyme
VTTLLFTHPACLDHDPGPQHPERPARLAAILDALDGPDFAALDRRVAPRADDAQLMLVHPALHVQRILGAVPPQGRARIDADTALSPGSGEAALRAAGAVCAAVDAVVAGEGKNAFCAVRPPGHHAEPDRAMGFCLFNNVAVGALHARKKHNLRRVAVIDFDVHHGNGTQAAFERDADLFYTSTHQSPLYPGTGAMDERGVANNILNLPLPPGADSDLFRLAMEKGVLVALEAFRPEMILISAGFDAHAADPLANMELKTEDFGWATERLAEVARKTCGGRLVSTLEGGYDLDALAESAAAHVRALMAA